MRGYEAEIAKEDWGSLEPTFYLEPADTTSSVTAVFLTLFVSVIFLMASSLNTLFLVIFLRKPSLRNISNRFIVSLTVSNLAAAWVLLPMVVTDTFLQEWRPSSESTSDPFGLPESSRVICTSFNVAADFVTSASVFGTVIIAFDRFFAITDPLHYHQMVTKSRSCIFIVLGWFLAGSVGAFSGLINDKGSRWNICQLEGTTALSTSEDGFRYATHLSYALISFFICFVLPLLMLSWTYSRIYGAAQQNSERTRRSSLCNPTADVTDHTKAASRSSSTRSTSSQIVSNIRHRLSNASLILYKEEARAAKISVAVVVLFFICWCPYYVLQIVDATIRENKIPMYLFKVVLIFTLLNSAISPYVYIYRSKRIQREVLRLFGVSIKSRRSEFDKKRPNYHQLPASTLEKIPASPVGLESGVKLEIPLSNCSTVAADDRFSKGNFIARFFCKKFLSSNLWRDSLILSNSSCVSSSSSSSNSYGPPAVSKGIQVSSSSPSVGSSLTKSQTLTNLVCLDKGALLIQHQL